MASYAKATLATFKEKLNQDGFKSLSGAKKSIGKSTFSDEEKAKALRMAEKFFGETSSDTKPAAKKAKKTSTKATAKPKKVATKSKTTKTRVSKSKKEHVESSAEEVSGPIQRITAVNYVVGTVQHVLTCMEQARGLGANETEIAKGAQEAQHTLMKCVGEVLSVVESGTSPEDMQKAEQVKKLAGAMGGGNHQDGPALPKVEQPEQFVSQ